VVVDHHVGQQVVLAHSSEAELTHGIDHGWGTIEQDQRKASDTDIANAQPPTSQETPLPLSLCV
jgi:hypothetical protein